MKGVIKTTSAAAMYNPVSQATFAPNGMVYTAGMIGRSPETGEMLPSFDEQAHQALQNLGALLKEAGGGFRDVMFIQLYLLDIARIEQFNEIFKIYFLEGFKDCFCTHTYLDPFDSIVVHEFEVFIFGKKRVGFKVTD